MTKDFKKLELYEVLSTSDRNKEWFDRQVAMVEDHRKDDREAAQECKSCFYSMKVGGAAITSTSCGLCAKEMNFGSTNVDRLCQECASSHRLCKHCGGDIDFKQRRKI